MGKHYEKSRCRLRYLTDPSNAVFDYQVTLTVRSYLRAAHYKGTTKYVFKKASKESNYFGKRMQFILVELLKQICLNVSL